MKLISSPTSPFVRKVRVAALEVGVHDRIEIVDANPWVGDTVSRHNPLGKVPALVTEERTLIDSPVICEYLDSLHAGPKLFPSGEARMTALHLQALGDGMMDATVLRRLETLRDEGKRSLDWIERQVAAIRRTLAAIAAAADGLTDRAHIGTVTVACALGYLDHRFAEENWRATYPALSSWFSQWSARPSMRATAPPR